MDVDGCSPEHSSHAVEQEINGLQILVNDKHSTLGKRRRVYKLATS
jgi:hypothetical protein